MTRMEFIIEGERRGILPEEQQAFLDEARRRGLVPDSAEPINGKTITGVPEDSPQFDPGFEPDFADISPEGTFSPRIDRFAAAEQAPEVFGPDITGLPPEAEEFVGTEVASFETEADRLRLLTQAVEQDIGRKSAIFVGSLGQGLINLGVGAQELITAPFTDRRPAQELHERLGIDPIVPQAETFGEMLAGTAGSLGAIVIPLGGIFKAYRAVYAPATVFGAMVLEGLGLSTLTQLEAGTEFNPGALAKSFGFGTLFPVGRRLRTAPGRAALTSILAGAYEAATGKAIESLEDVQRLIIAAGLGAIFGAVGGTTRELPWLKRIKPEIEAKIAETQTVTTPEGDVTTTTITLEGLLRAAETVGLSPKEVKEAGQRTKAPLDPETARLKEAIVAKAEEQGVDLPGEKLQAERLGLPRPEPVPPQMGVPETAVRTPKGTLFPRGATGEFVKPTEEPPFVPERAPDPDLVERQELATRFQQGTGLELSEGEQQLIVRGPIEQARDFVEEAVATEVFPPKKPPTEKTMEGLVDDARLLGAKTVSETEPILPGKAPGTPPRDLELLKADLAEAGARDVTPEPRTEPTEAGEQVVIEGSQAVTGFAEQALGRGREAEGLLLDFVEQQAEATEAARQVDIESEPQPTVKDLADRESLISGDINDRARTIREAIRFAGKINKESLIREAGETLTEGAISPSLINAQGGGFNISEIGHVLQNLIRPLTEETAFKDLATQEEGMALLRDAHVGLEPSKSAKGLGERKGTGIPRSLAAAASDHVIRDTVGQEIFDATSRKAVEEVFFNRDSEIRRLPKSDRLMLVELKALKLEKFGEGLRPKERLVEEFDILASDEPLLAEEMGKPLDEMKEPPDITDEFLREFDKEPKVERGHEGGRLGDVGFGGKINPKRIHFNKIEEITGIPVLTEGYDQGQVRNRARERWMGPHMNTLRDIFGGKLLGLKRKRLGGVERKQVDELTQILDLLGTDINEVSSEQSAKIRMADGKPPSERVVEATKRIKNDFFDPLRDVAAQETPSGEQLITPDQFVKSYMPLVRKFGVEGAWDKMDARARELAKPFFVHARKDIGMREYHEFIAREQDSSKIAMLYLTTLARARYIDGAFLTRMEGFADALDKGGSKNAAEFTRRYIDHDLRDFPTRSTGEARVSVETFAKLLPKGIREHLNIDKLSNDVINLVYPMYMGYSPAPVLMNNLQKFHNVAIQGTRKTFQGVRRWRTDPEYKALINASGIISRAADFLAGTGRGMRWFARTDWGNRASIYGIQYEAIEALGPKASLKELKTLDGWEMLSEPQTRHIVDLLKKGEVGGVRGLSKEGKVLGDDVNLRDGFHAYADALQQIAQYPYEKGATGEAFRGPIGRQFGVFQSWRINYIHFLRAIARKGDKDAGFLQSNKGRAKRVGRLIVAGVAAQQVFQHATGIDITRWLFMGPLTGGLFGPVPQMTMSGLKAATAKLFSIQDELQGLEPPFWAEQSVRDFKREVKGTPFPVPGGRALRDLLVGAARGDVKKMFGLRSTTRGKKKKGVEPALRGLPGLGEFSLPTRGGGGLPESGSRGLPGIR